MRYQAVKLQLLGFVLSLAVVSCATPFQKSSDPLVVRSADYGFIDQLLDPAYHAPVREIEVWLTMPEDSLYPAPFPVVVLLHSSWGLSSQEWFYAEQFRQHGIATFSIDSFTSRGVSKTSLDQTAVSSASMLADAFAVLKYIKTDTRFDAERVAVMGFSKGGIVAFYSALKEIQQVLGSGQQFAAHIAYYPWCGLHLLDMETTNAPMLIHGGGKDIVTPIQVCRDLIQHEIPISSAKRIEMHEYPAARHAFDHPLLAKIPIPISMNAQVPADCSIHETSPGKFTEKHNNEHVSSQNIKQVLQMCSKYNGIAGYDRQAAQEALKVTKDFLDAQFRIRTARN